MSNNIVKTKPKGINIEHHGSVTSGVCTMVWYYLEKKSFFFLLETYFPLQKQRCRIKHKSLEYTCSQVEYTKNHEDCKEESNENKMVD